jgi:HEAT repeat protein
MEILSMGEMRQESEKILEDLASLGIQLTSLSDLLHLNIDYREAIPLLIEWLHKVENKRVKEVIVRALTTKWAKSIASESLLMEFRKCSQNEETGLKWAIGNALSETADENNFQDIVGLIKDKKHGRSREMLVVALGNMNNPEKTRLLIDLLDDDQLVGHALIALKKSAPIEAKDKIEGLLNHPRNWVRNEAEKTLNRINKKA